MKELTIEEKAQRYDEAIERAKNFIENGDERERTIAESIFAGLMEESEGEKIRKEIISALKFANHKGVYDKHLAWLEKQGEHANFRNKIQIGDKVTRNEDGVLVNLSQLKRVAKKDEKQGEQKPNPYSGTSFEYNGHTWGMCARDNGVEILIDGHIKGRVFTNDSNAKEMFIKALERVEEQNNKGYKLTDCDKNSWWEDFKAYTSCIIEQKPAGKVEPKFKVGDKIRKKVPRLFDKDMQVARIEKDYYVCNHIGKFSSEVVPFSKESSYDLIEQKPAWGEEDEYYYGIIQYILNNECVGKADKENAINWFNSLKDRVQPQPKQEWSNDDESMLYGVIETEQYMLDVVTGVKTFDVGNEQIKSQCTKELAWLKILKDRYTWKPNDEQMKALSIAMCGVDDPLFSLYQDLLKLKG